MASATSRRALWLQKIADQIAHLISQRIADGALSPGQSPGGREELAGEFVTSLSVVDRALEQLAGEGLLERGEDGGFLVTDAPPREKALALHPGETLKDVVAVLELRLGLEAVAAASAADRRDDAQMAAIEAAATAFEAAVDEGSGVAQADFRFHHAIAVASGNPYLRELLDYLGPLLMPRMRMSLPQSGGAARDENLARSVGEHREIVTAISDRNPDAARNAMRQHLMRTIAFVNRSSAPQ